MNIIYPHVKSHGECHKLRYRLQVTVLHFNLYDSINIEYISENFFLADNSLHASVCVSTGIIITSVLGRKMQISKRLRSEDLRDVFLTGFDFSCAMSARGDFTDRIEKQKSRKCALLFTHFIRESPALLVSH